MSEESFWDKYGLGNSSFLGKDINVFNLSDKEYALMESLAFPLFKEIADGIFAGKLEGDKRKGLLFLLILYFHKENSKNTVELVRGLCHFMVAGEISLLLLADEGKEADMISMIQELIQEVYSSLIRGNKQ